MTKEKYQQLDSLLREVMIEYLQSPNLFFGFGDFRTLLETLCLISDCLDSYE